MLLFHRFVLFYVFRCCVCVMVLLTWRSGLIVASLIPLSIFMTLIALYVLKIPLQRMSLAGLIIALGLLIDNGLVIVEETRFAMDQGIDHINLLAPGQGFLDDAHDPAPLAFA